MILGLYSTLTIILSVVAVVGPLGAIAAVIFIPAIAIPIISKIISGFLNCRICMALSVLVVASVVSFWIGHHDAYKRGVDDTVAKIARGDAKLVDRARAGRAKLLSCQAQDKRWDQTTGACR